ncbi:MAG: UDP-N-acetylmuramoyl-tripeptide--D-alanyl-D-alanine ligase [Pseudomonadota bacterium]
MTGPLWTSAEAEAATGGRATMPFDVSGISIDSRDIAQGDLFVALSDVRDGHEFVAAAIRGGAVAALVTHRPDTVADEFPLLIVDDTLKALESMGQTARERITGKVVGVTGSVGKTGVKEMLRVCLSAAGPTHAAVKSFNNHWGVPLTLARIPHGTEFAAIEMGMNHPGEIGPLSRMARPDVAIITTIAPVHMAAFKDLSGIADAKAEIFEGLVPGGTAILNMDNAYFGQLKVKAEAAGANIVAFGSDASADICLEQAHITAGATVVKARMHEAPLVFKLSAPGEHLALNALAALAATEAAGGDLARAALAISNWNPPDGRGSRWTISIGETGIDGSITLIDESYNANPTSVRAALAVLGASEPADHYGRVDEGRRIAFLGDMLELGADEVALHAGLAECPEMAKVDTVHTCGPLMKALHEALPPAQRGTWFKTSRDMADRVGRKLDAGDVAMIKGSLGSDMAVVVDAVRRMGKAVREGT